MRDMRRETSDTRLGTHVSRLTSDILLLQSAFFLSTFSDSEFRENKKVVSMAKVPGGIMNLLREYVAELEKNNIHLRTAILFGRKQASALHR